MKKTQFDLIIGWPHNQKGANTNMHFTSIMHRCTLTHTSKTCVYEGTSLSLKTDIELLVEFWTEIFHCIMFISMLLIDITEWIYTEQTGFFSLG